MGRKRLAAVAAAVIVLAGTLYIAHLAGRRPAEREGAPGSDEPLPRGADRPAATSKTFSPEVKRWTVTGRVLRKGGRPAGRVLIRLDPPPREMRTGADGRFLFADVPPGESIHLTIDEPSSALRILRFELSEVADDRGKDLGDITLEPALGLIVKLVGSRDEPMEKGKVILKPQVENEEKREGEERGPGEFIFGRLPPGSYTVSGSAPGRVGKGKSVELPREDPLILKLEDGHRIAGTVRASDGTPIEGAEVKYDDEVKVKTDTSGRFLIDTLDEGSHYIQAASEGFVTVSKKISTGVEDVEFWLIREAVISGRVVCEEDDRPIKDAEIVVKYSATARSGDDGRFEFRKLPRGSYEILVRHDEHLPVKGLTFEVASGDRIEDIVIRMEKGFSIGGKVLDSASGSPLEGVWVTFSLHETDNELYIGRGVSTGIAGTFLVKGLKQGTYSIHAQKKGFRLDPLEFTVSQTLEEPIVLRLEKEEKDLTLAKISGRILDPDGNAVEDASVMLLSPTGIRQNVRVTGEGCFRFEYVAPGKDYEIHAFDRVNCPGRIAGIQADPGQAVEGIEVRLSRGGIIRGRILDEKGDGIEDARIYLGSLSGPSPPLGSRSSFTETSDAGGNFEIKGISPGFYTLNAATDGRSKPPSRSIAISEGETIDGQDFILAAGLELQGRVADTEGNPLSGARIKVLGKEASSGSDGAFQIKGLPSGWVKLDVNREGFERKVMKTLLPGKEVLVELDRMASISGRIQAQGRDVLLSGKLKVFEIQGHWESTEFDATGRFQLQVPKGTYRLEASVSGFARSRVEIVLAPGEKREGVVIELRSGGTIHGRTVRRGSGEPVEGVFLYVEGVSAKSGSDGTFMIEKIAEGEVDLEASHSDFATVKLQQIPVHEGETHEVTIELSPGGSIRGSVSTGGKPFDWRVHLMHGGGNFSKYSSLDRDGRFEFQGLPVGEYSVSFMDRIRTMFKERVFVREGQVTEMDIEMGIVRFSCRVTSGGKPAWFAKVSVVELEKDWEGENTVTDAGGNFAMDLPFPGPYVFKIFPSEGGTARIEVTVPEGVKEFRKDLDLDSREISGTVLDAATGEPVDSAEVLALSPGFSSRSLASLFQALRGIGSPDGSGRFTISHLAPGSYGLLVRPLDGHLPMRIDGVAAGSGGDLSIALEKGAAISLKVLDGGGRPIEGAWAILRNRSGDILQFLDGDESNAQGILALQGIRPGSYRATVGHATYAPAKDGEQQIVLKSGGTVRVTVIGPGGEPARGASVLLLDEGGDDIAEELGLFARGRYVDSWKLLRNDLFTGKDGSLTIRHVPAGAYPALARRGAARSSEERLQVTEGQLVEASLILSE